MSSKLSVNITDVVAGYEGARETVLSGVTLDVAAGEFIGIVGPNGSGKTTLLRVISRILRPGSGSVLLGEKDIFTIPSREFARLVGVVPQDTIPAFDFSVIEIVLMGRSPHLGRFQSEGRRDIAIAEEAMSRTGTLDLAARPFAALSGGERQRVVIARALAQEPRVILLDEPTSHLDISYQFEILNLIRGLNREQGITVLAVLHDLNLAAQYCDRLAMLGDGKIQALGKPSDVLTAENVKRIYGAEVWVRRHPTSGRPYVIAGIGRPVSEAETREFEHRPKVHVICGGGSGAPIFAKLLRRGYEVTAGVLNQGDTDQEAAEALGIRYVPAPPFTAASDAALAADAQMAREADVVVISDAPYGTANLPGLKSVAAAEGLRIVLLRPESISQRDFTGGDAVEVIESLASRASSVNTLDDLAASIENGK